MFAQAISGVDKDLNKMSAKSAIKTVIPETPENESQAQRQLFKWVTVLTGSNNALKGWLSKGNDRILCRGTS